MPHEEFAELRRTAPVWWQSAAHARDGFDDEGYWAVSKHADVAAVSKDRQLLDLGERRDHPVPRGHGPRERREQRVILLNQDAPDHTSCARSSRAASPRARSRPARRAHQRARTIVAEAAAEGRGRLRRGRRRRAAAAGDRRAARRPAGGPRQALRVVQPDDVLRRPGLRPGGRSDGVVRDPRLRDGDGRRAQGDPRDDIITKLVNADIDGAGPDTTTSSASS